MKIRTLLPATLLLVSPLALAATATDNMAVSASVIDSCLVTAGNLDFGDVDVIANANDDTTATIDVTCSNGTSFDIGLDYGGNEDTGQRRMDDGSSNYLLYDVYSDAGRSTAWGDDVGVDTVSDTGDGTENSYTVYGRIPAGQQTADVGAYTDTVLVTVTY